jgi:endonuclease/exonuclease/phosphatase family metal-dependent hydrolase
VIEPYNQQGVTAMFIKLISLNIWGGRVKEPLREFFRQHRDIDIFCLQEVFSQARDSEIIEVLTDNPDGIITDFGQELEQLLPEHQVHFLPTGADCYGLAMAVKKNLTVKSQGVVTLYHGPKFPDPDNRWADHDRKMQWLEIVKNGHSYCIMNVHGHWKKDKLDDKDCLHQNVQILNFLMHTGRLPKILVGDFNLLPQTTCIKRLGGALFDLIKANRVKSTRTSLCKSKDRFADYAFVSPDVNVVDFAVMPDEVSDHNPLYLEFN